MGEIIPIIKNKQKYMKILFLLFHGFSKDSGISKKIHYQVKGLIENGHIVYTCHYEKLSNGIRVRMIDNKVIQNFGNGYIANIKKNMETAVASDVPFICAPELGPNWAYTDKMTERDFEDKEEDEDE